MSLQVVSFDTLRSLAYTGISSSFAAVGTAITQQVRIICFTNSSDVDMIFTDDGSNSKIIVPAASFKLFDLTTNRLENQKTFVVGPGTLFSVKTSGSPTRGSVYIECIY